MHNGVNRTLAVGLTIGSRVRWIGPVKAVNDKVVIRPGTIWRVVDINESGSKICITRYEGFFSWEPPEFTKRMINAQANIDPEVATSRGG